MWDVVLGVTVRAAEAPPRALRTVVLRVGRSSGPNSGGMPRVRRLARGSVMDSCERASASASGEARVVVLRAACLGFARRAVCWWLSRRAAGLPRDGAGASGRTTRFGSGGSGGSSGEEGSENGRSKKLDSGPEYATGLSNGAASTKSRDVFRGVGASDGDVDDSDDEVSDEEVSDDEVSDEDGSGEELTTMTSRVVSRLEAPVAELAAAVFHARRTVRFRVGVMVRESSSSWGVCWPACVGACVFVCVWGGSDVDLGY